MAAQPDDTFYDRADAHIAVANEQCRTIGKGKVSASFLYGAARFNAYNGAVNAGSLKALQDEKDNIVDYYLKQYREMLIEHLDDYIENYGRYMATPEKGDG